MENDIEDAYEKTGFYCNEFNPNDIMQVIEVVENDGIVLSLASDRLKNGRDVVMKAVEQSAHAFLIASVELKRDKGIVLKAVCKDGLVLAFVSEDLKNDKEVFQTAFQQNKSALVSASTEIREKNEKNIEKLGFDEDDVIDLIKISGGNLNSVLQFLTPRSTLYLDYLT